jgi:hypothetical protein
MDFARGNQGNQQSITFASILAGLRSEYATPSRLDPVTLSSDAAQALTAIARGVAKGLAADDARALFVELTPAEQEAVQSKMATRGVPNPQQVIDEGKFFEFAPWTVLLRLVEAHPELFFDGRCWDVPFASLDYGHASATDAARAQIVRQYAGLMTDTIWLAGQDPADLATVGRARLLRCSLAIDLLAITGNGPAPVQ